MQYIRQEIDASPVVLFMKGTPEQPYCGFSGGVVRILKELRVQFKGVDILENPQLRTDLKIFSQWPTFPQLYIEGQFIGGFDIVKDMYETGELMSLVAPYISSSLEE